MSAMHDVLGYSFNQRAILAGVMIGFLNGYLGGYVVLRRAALFAGALSHTLFPGIALGAFLAGLNPVSALVGASLTALVVGLGAQGMASTSRLDHNATLAILFTAAFGGGLLLLKHLGLYVRIEDYLFGNILGLSNFDLWFSFATGLGAMLILLALQRPLLLFLFSREVAETQGVPVVALDYLMAAILVVTMITSLQAVGSILTLGLLVAPASILYLYVESPRVIMWGGGVMGAAVSVAAVFLSNWWNVQTGATIVLMLGVIFLVSFVLSPQYGLLGQALRRLRPEHTPRSLGAVLRGLVRRWGRPA
ncbi:MAG: metal ABC transporter permease [Lentisphaerae bacterium]|nr:metal ABC transporter permease [Lentisphaerota bacterium]